MFKDGFFTLNTSQGKNKIFIFEVQCVTIENRQSPFYIVNRVILTGKKLY